MWQAALALLALAEATAAPANAPPVPAPPLYVTHNQGLRIAVPSGLTYCPLLQLAGACSAACDMLGNGRESG